MQQVNLLQFTLRGNASPMMETINASINTAIQELDTIFPVEVDVKYSTTLLTDESEYSHFHHILVTLKFEVTPPSIKQWDGDTDVLGPLPNELEGEAYGKAFPSPFDDVPGVVGENDPYFTLYKEYLDTFYQNSHEKVALSYGEWVDRMEADILEKKQEANFNAMADGMAPPYPSVY